MPKLGSQITHENKELPMPMTILGTRTFLARGLIRLRRKVVSANAHSPSGAGFPNSRKCIRGCLVVRSLVRSTFGVSFLTRFLNLTSFEGIVDVGVGQWCIYFPPTELWQSPFLRVWR